MKNKKMLIGGGIAVLVIAAVAFGLNGSFLQGRLSLPSQEKMVVDSGRFSAPSRTTVQETKTSQCEDILYEYSALVALDLDSQRQSELENQYDRYSCHTGDGLIAREVDCGEIDRVMDLYYDGHAIYELYENIGKDVGCFAEEGSEGESVDSEIRKIDNFYEEEMRSPLPSAPTRLR